MTDQEPLPNTEVERVTQPTVKAADETRSFHVRRAVQIEMDKPYALVVIPSYPAVEGYVTRVEAAWFQNEPGSEWAAEQIRIYFNPRLADGRRGKAVRHRDVSGYVAATGSMNADYVWLLKLVAPHWPKTVTELIEELPLTKSAKAKARPHSELAVPVEHDGTPEATERIQAEVLARG